MDSTDVNYEPVDGSYPPDVSEEELLQEAMADSARSLYEGSDDRLCRTFAPNSGLVCTRMQGHDEMHVASTPGRHLAYWYDGAPLPTNLGVKYHT